MSFKTTVKTQRLSHFVASSALGFADKVQEVLANKWSGLLREGESLPDIRLLQELLGRFLEQRGNQLLEADDRYSGDRVIARELQLERKEQVRLLRLRLREIRQFFDRLGKDRSSALLPKRAFSALGAAELIREANQAALILGDPERSGARIASSGSASQAEMLAGLEADARRLQEVLDRQEGLQARRKQIGLEVKAAETAATDLAVRGGVSLLAGLYSLADLPFHAQRIRRPSRSKPEKPEGEMEEKAAEAEIAEAAAEVAATG